MSRIGRKPINIPEGVEVGLKGVNVYVKGKLGELSFEHQPTVSIEIKENIIHVSRENDEKKNRELHGLTRALVQNMINGVDDHGFRLFYNGAFFGYKSWENILIGFELFNGIYNGSEGKYDKYSIKSILNIMEDRKKKLVYQTNKMKTHYQYLMDNIYNKRSDVKIE